MLLLVWCDRSDRQTRSQSRVVELADSQVSVARDLGEGPQEVVVKQDHAVGVRHRVAEVPDEAVSVRILWIGCSSSNQIQHAALALGWQPATVCHASNFRGMLIGDDVESLL